MPASDLFEQKRFVAVKILLEDPDFPPAQLLSYVQSAYVAADLARIGMVAAVVLQGDPLLRIGRIRP